MRIVVPISRSDYHLLPQWIEVHEALRTAGLNHQLFLVVPQPIASEAHDAKARLNELFESVTVHQIDYEPYGGHPKAPNMHFYECAKLMAQHNPNIPWQLVELDCLPRTSNAYDVIAGKYASCGNPFFGFIDKTPWRETEEFVEGGKDAQGKPVMVPNPRYGMIVASRHGDGDLMLSGCAVYPGNMINRPNFGGLMADFMKGHDSPDEAWDIYLRAAMANDGMAHTNLIASKWNTGKYRVENGSLVCDSLTTHEIFQRNPDWAIRECGGVVHPEAVLIHGCKDDSLFNIIVGGQITPPVAAPKPFEAHAQPAPTTPSNDDYRIKKLEEGQSQMMTILQQLAASLPKAQAPVATPAPAAQETSELTLLERVSKAMPEGKSIRLNDLASTLQVEMGTLRTEIEGSASFVIKGPANWVQRRAA